MSVFLIRSSSSRSEARLPACVSAYALMAAFLFGNATSLAGEEWDTMRTVEDMEAINRNVKAGDAKDKDSSDEIETLGDDSLATPWEDRQSTALDDPKIGPETRVSSPCTSSETWQFDHVTTDTIPESSLGEFVKFLSGKRIPFIAFSEAVHVMQTLKSVQGQAFAYYWVGRTLFGAKLYSEAAKWFSYLMAVPPAGNQIPFQLAGIACLERIHDRAPHISYSKEALENLEEFFSPMMVSDRALSFLTEASVRMVLKLINEGDTEAADKALMLLDENGPYAHFVRGLLAVRADDTDGTIFHLNRLMSAKHLPPSIRKHLNELRILLAAAYYDTEDYEKSIRQLELVDKSSNDLVHALARISSTYLMAGNLEKAIGTGLLLNSGAFQKTFAPEALTVMAAAMNDLCRYPDSLYFVDILKKEYARPYEWLRSRVRHADNTALYSRAVAFLKGRDTDVPQRVASEWVRSPVFIAQQQGINSIFESVRSIPSLREQVAVAIEKAQRERNSLKERVNATLSELNEPASATRSSSPEVTKLTRAIDDISARIDRLEGGRLQWQRTLQRYWETAPKEATRAVATIERHLRALNERMFRQLTRVSENIDVIEAELMTGASQEIITSHAQRARQEASGKRDLSGTGKPIQYDWRLRGALSGIEVWDDELGSLEANVQSKCTRNEKKHNSRSGTNDQER